MFYLGTKNLTLNKMNNKIAYDILSIIVEMNDYFKLGDSLNEEIVQYLLPEFYGLFVDEGLKLIKQTYTGLRDNFIRMPKEVYNHIIFYAIEWQREADEDDGINVIGDIATEAYKEYEKEIKQINQNDEGVHVDLDTLAEDIKEPWFIKEALLFYDWDFLDVDMKIFNPAIRFFGDLDADYFLELIPFDMRTNLLNSKTDFGTAKNITDDIDIFSELRNSLKDFSHAVTHHKLNKIYRDANFDEKTIQIYLYDFFNTYFRKENIDIVREKDTGRGWLDFSFSIGKESKVLLEIKVDKNPYITDNLEFQLLTYMVADKAEYGIFALIITSDEHFKRIDEYKALCEERGEKEGKKVTFIPIDAREKPTASNVKNVEEV